MSLDKQKMQQLVVEYNVLVEYANALQKSMENLTSIIKEAEVTKRELEVLSKIESSTELLVPIGPLAFIKTNVGRVESVILNLGAGVYRELRVDEAISRVEKYMKAINEELEKTAQTYRRVATRIVELENILKKVGEVKEKKGG